MSHSEVLAKVLTECFYNSHSRRAMAAFNDFVSFGQRIGTRGQFKGSYGKSGTISNGDASPGLAARAWFIANGEGIQFGVGRPASGNLAALGP